MKTRLFHKAHFSVFAPTAFDKWNQIYPDLTSQLGAPVSPGCPLPSRVSVSRRRRRVHHCVRVLGTRHRAPCRTAEFLLEFPLALNLPREQPRLRLSLCCASPPSGAPPLRSYNSSRSYATCATPSGSFTSQG